MKKYIFTALVLIVNLSFAQEEKKNEFSFQSNLFDTNIEENHFSIKEANDNKISTLFPEIFSLKLKDFTNNSEGKFSISKDNKELFVQSYTNSDNKNLNQNYISNKSYVSLDMDDKFVNKIIVKKMVNENVVLDESQSYGDRNLELYRSNFPSTRNELITEFRINSNFELQIGKSLYPYLNKNLKTELDRTLQNSINLLALNF
jgi:hypothetical protein